MHIEIQVALNFLISFLYNKLPRRRVNQFGEELEKALKIKFDGHWYPEKAFKGSAYRCVKTAPPLDPVFEAAARESGMDLDDIQENLPQELSMWIDPGEVSYRFGEKGPVKVLYREAEGPEDSNTDREVTRTFNPEAQCFKPIDSVATQLGNMSLAASSSAGSPFGSSPSPTYKSASPINAFVPKSTAPLTFTTATFAQTKFGSTKLKTSSKRSHRMSPTEFSHYIKQRAILQQNQQVAAAAGSPHHPQSAAAIFAAAAAAAATAAPQQQQQQPPQRPRSLSPNPQQTPQLDPSFLLLASGQAAAAAVGVAAAAAAAGGQPPPAPPQFGTQQAHFSSPTATRSFASPPAIFDNAYLGDLFSSSTATATTPVISASNTAAKISQSTAAPPQPQQSQQRPQPQGPNGSSRFTSFFDKSFLQGGASGAAAAAAAAANGLNVVNFGDSTAAKNFGFDGVSFNLNAMPYPNQYQHLLVAN